MTGIEIIRTQGLPFQLGTWEVYYCGEFVGLGENQRGEPDYDAALALARKITREVHAAPPSIDGGITSGEGVEAAGASGTEEVAQ